jgi:hypothetical protein
MCVCVCVCVCVRESVCARMIEAAPALSGHPAVAQGW